MFKKKEDCKNNINENDDLKKDLEDNEEETLDDTDVQEDKDDNKDSSKNNEQELKKDELIKNISSENEKLKNENKKAKNELEALKDRLARVTAEYDNFRKRTAKEKEKIYTEACEDILKQMLPVLDNLERAISVEGNMDDLKQGIDMTMKQFNDAFKKLNVEEIPTDGQFDPHIHSAVMHIEDESYEENSIVEVFQKGYKREDKVIRPSMVKVAN
ncbi:molecular chaperone GrpE [Clostridium algifaecis]|uniref:Protein GrpE n=1 Tax=Clostridium algifaecis TaxID=1472040 RepID=A0ABS4KSM2_9CLOT|nr:nucleotide exchange factor GrpE [Clostridium algifaecis]MBP2033030.1 molecular chaperone GrpE [Clostridium algifaecis]